MALFKPKYLPKALRPDIITLGTGASTYEHKHLVHSTICINKVNDLALFAP